jgi:DNA-binding CsgD family transcriptional regulator
MREASGHIAKACRNDCLGLIFLFSWVYVTLFGCGLATKPFIRWGLEYFWSAAGLGCAVIGIGALVAVGHVKVPRSTTLSVVAAVFAVVGTFSIWLGYFDNALFWYMRTLCGVSCGIGFTMLGVLWYARMCALDEEEIEFTVAAAFMVSFILYCVILLLKPSSIAVLVVDALFPPLSVYFLHKADLATLDEVLPTTPQEKHHALANYATLSILVALLWFLVAYFRVLTTPVELGNRFTHFLISFFAASIIAAVLFVCCLRMSRHLNFTLIVRWPLPLFALSCVVYFMNPTDPLVRMIAYSINFVGMFGVQFGCWVSGPKYLRRTHESPLVMALSITAAQGVGIYTGFAVSRSLVEAVPVETLSSISLIIVIAVLAAAMLVGFNPRWYLNGASQSRTFAKIHMGVENDDGAEDVVPTQEEGATASVAAQNASLDELFNQQALALQSDYKLTDRETEVAALLLAGRSRPYIRDELFISSNTVNTHVRRIFMKCDVHSQQELLDLARSA